MKIFTAQRLSPLMGHAVCLQLNRVAKSKAEVGLYHISSKN